MATSAALVTTLSRAHRPHGTDSREPAPVATADGADYDTALQALRDQVPAGHDLLWVRTVATGGPVGNA